MGLVAIVVLGLPAVVFADNVLRNQNGNLLHWRDDDSAGFPRGFLYWVDRTGPRWPVFSSAIEWDRAPRVDAVYRTSCPGRHCVGVSTADLGQCRTVPRLLGRTFTPSFAGGHLRGSTRVQFNGNCGDQLNRAQRRMVACHELGHSLGLAHYVFSAPSTCMRSSFPAILVPRAHDYRMLNERLYNHDDPG